MVSQKRLDMRAPLVSCIVVTYNSQEYLKKCLTALQKVTYSNLEILVIDNQSTDKSLIIAQKFSPKIHVFVNSKNEGYAGGHMTGIKKARGKYFFLLNPDTFVRPDFLEPLVDAAEKNKKIAAVQPLVYLTNQPKTINLSGKVPHYLGFDWLRDYEANEVRESGQILSFSGSGILLSAESMVQVGGLDSTYFMYYEDSDLSWRLRMNGFILWYCAESVIYHDYKFLPDEKYQALTQKLFWAERNRIYTILKNYSLSSLVLFAPIFFFMEFGLLVYFTTKGWLKIKLNSYVSLWSSRQELKLSRANVQVMRTVEDRDLIRNFQATIEFSLFKHPVAEYLLNPVLWLYWKLIWPLV